jgi:hypothetical protein
VRHPETADLDGASDLLARLAATHGLTNLRHGSESGEIVADVDQGRSYFDVVAFEVEVEGRLGWRPDVVPSGAPGARPGQPVGAGGRSAA